ncbi:MAG: hypothetical protein ACI8SR_003021 [Oceanicoccus sp.]|jgi:hypothetical protein
MGTKPRTLLDIVGVGAFIFILFMFLIDGKYGFRYHVSYINNDINKVLWYQYGEIVTSLKIKEIRSPDPMSFFTDIEVDFIHNGKLKTISLEIENRKSLKVSWLNIHSNHFEHRGPSLTPRSGSVSPLQKYNYTLEYNKYLISRAIYSVSKYKNIKDVINSIPTLSDNPYRTIKDIQCLKKDVIDINCEMVILPFLTCVKSRN